MKTLLGGWFISLMVVAVATHASAQAEPVPVVVAPAQGEATPPPGYQQAAPAQPAYGSEVIVPAAPARSGFTLELGLGVGYVNVSGIDYSKAGLYGMTLSLGGFISPNLALAFRASGVTTFETGGTLTFASALASVQYFATEQLSVGGGLGLMIAQANADKYSLSSDPGFGLNARVGYTLVDFGGSALRAALELNVGWIEGESVVNSGLGLEYQLF